MQVVTLLLDPVLLGFAEWELVQLIYNVLGSELSCQVVLAVVVALDVRQQE